MLTEEFCDYLEWQLGDLLEKLSKTDERLKGFWCDGILLPESENDYAKKAINDRRYVALTAFSGKTGQEHYKLTLLFGQKALSRYARGLSLEECVPDSKNSNCLQVDPVKKEMVMQLE